VSDKTIETLPTELHDAGCPCCSPAALTNPTGTSRRQFLATSAAVLAGGIMGFVPGRSMAGGGNYEAMLVNCIDPRFTTLSWQYMGLLSGVERDKLGDNYSHFVMAGGPIGAVHPKFLPGTRLSGTTWTSRSVCITSSAWSPCPTVTAARPNWLLVLAQSVRRKWKPALTQKR